MTNWFAGQQSMRAIGAPAGVPPPPPTKFAVFHRQIVKNPLVEPRPFRSNFRSASVQHGSRTRSVHLHAKQLAAPQVPCAPLLRLCSCDSLRSISLRYARGLPSPSEEKL